MSRAFFEMLVDPSGPRHLGLTGEVSECLWVVLPSWFVAAVLGVFLAYFQLVASCPCEEPPDSLRPDCL